MRHHSLSSSSLETTKPLPLAEVDRISIGKRCQRLPGFTADLPIPASSWVLLVGTDSTPHSTHSLRTSCATYAILVVHVHATVCGRVRFLNVHVHVNNTCTFTCVDCRRTHQSIVHVYILV